MAAPQKQVDLRSLLDGMKHKEMVSDDFAAAFLQAGIPPNKLDHPSLLWFPITAAYIERTFSLAGLVDAKNRQKMSSSLRQAAVGMYCNGDVECRFTEP